MTRIRLERIDIMEDEIKVGDYIRTKNGYIRKVITERLDGYLVDESYYNEIIKDKTLGIIENEDVTNHSPNIIDLIEVGDYVNGEQITDIYYGDRVSSIKSNFSEEDIKNIVTKEQMAQIEYKVKE